MITRLLEAEAIINNTTIQIINTEMNILVDYDINKIYALNSIYGEFSYNTQKPNYQKKTIIKFNIINDYTWSTILTSDKPTFITQEVLDNIIPVFASINFDTKTIKINFS